MCIALYLILCFIHSKLPSLCLDTYIPHVEKHKSSQEDVGIAAVFQPAEQTVPGHV